MATSVSRAWLVWTAGIALVSCVSPYPYVYLGELPGQPNEAQLGRYVAVDATSDEAPQVRLRARGGTLAALNGGLSASPICLALTDGELDAVVRVQPDNVEAAVTAELVASGNCADASPAGPATVLVIRSGTGTPTPSASSSTGTPTSTTSSTGTSSAGGSGSGMGGMAGVGGGT